MHSTTSMRYVETASSYLPERPRPLAPASAVPQQAYMPHMLLKAIYNVLILCTVCMYNYYPESHLAVTANLDGWATKCPP